MYMKASDLQNLYMYQTAVDRALLFVLENVTQPFKKFAVPPYNIMFIFKFNSLCLRYIIYPLLKLITKQSHRKYNKSFQNLIGYITAIFIV